MFKELYEKYVLRNYKWFIVVGGAILIIGLGIYYYLYHNKVQENNKRIVINDTKKEPVNEVSLKYYIDIKGEVTNPSVYQVEEGMRIIDVIRMAGGLTTAADTSVLNLGKKVNDEMVIIIYSKEEIKKFKESGQQKVEIIKYIEKDCKCPDPIVNEACINNTNNSDSTFKIALNTATKEELMTLPGIGEAKAQNIIDYRASNGLFKSIDDIKNITGIGDSIFDKIKDNITL